MRTFLLLIASLGLMAGAGARLRRSHLAHDHARRAVVARLDAAIAAQFGLDPSPYREAEAYRARRASLYGGPRSTAAD